MMVHRLAGSTQRWCRASIATVVAIAVFPTIASAADTTTPAASTGAGGAVVAHRSGDAVIVDSGTRAQQLQKGGSATELALKTPPNAQCPGDSRNDSWRVQTFVVPVTDDPATLKYTVIGPVGAHQFAAYGTDFTPVIDEFTIANTSPGLPGRLDQLRPMSFGVWVPGSMPDGTYRIGVACTLFGKTADFWDTTIVITNTPGDKPAQLTWQLASAPATPAGTSNRSGSAWLPIALVILVLVGGGAFVVRRRARSAAHP